MFSGHSYLLLSFPFAGSSRSQKDKGFGTNSIAEYRRHKRFLRLWNIYVGLGMDPEPMWRKFLSPQMIRPTMTLLILMKTFLLTPSQITADQLSGSTTTEWKWEITSNFCFKF